MSRINRGPGGGPKRRIRTRYTTAGNVLVVMRNRSIKPLPANWRELLIESVAATCELPPKHFYPHALSSPRHILTPRAEIPFGSLPTAMVLFTIDLNKQIAYLQKRAIDWSLSRCDVNTWPVPKPTSRISGGERFVNTGLLLVDRLVGDRRHSFNPHRLENVPGINWRHLEQYEARKGRARYLGIRTTCGNPCECRRTLPDLWPLGWEMYY